MSSEDARADALEAEADRLADAVIEGHFSGLPRNVRGNIVMPEDILRTSLALMWAQGYRDGVTKVSGIVDTATSQLIDELTS